MQPIAVYCSRLQGRRRKYALFLTPPPLCQRGGRRFAAELCSDSAKRAKPASEPGLVLQHSKALSRSCAEGLFVCGERAALGAAGVPLVAAGLTSTSSDGLQVASTPSLLKI